MGKVAGARNHDLGSAFRMRKGTRLTAAPKYCRCQLSWGVG